MGFSIVDLAIIRVSTVIRLGGEGGGVAGKEEEEYVSPGIRKNSGEDLLTGARGKTRRVKKEEMGKCDQGPVLTCGLQRLAGTRLDVRFLHRIRRREQAGSQLPTGSSGSDQSSRLCFAAPRPSHK